MLRFFLSLCDIKTVYSLFPNTVKSLPDEFNFLLDYGVPGFLKWGFQSLHIKGVLLATGSGTPPGLLPLDCLPGAGSRLLLWKISSFWVSKKQLHSCLICPILLEAPITWVMALMSEPLRGVLCCCLSAHGIKSSSNALLNPSNLSQCPVFLLSPATESFQ